MNKQSQFDNACARCDLKTLKLLLKNKRVNPAVNDNLAIRWASYKGDVGVVRLLLKDKRVDPFAKNNKAIQIASEKGHIEIVKLLTEHTLNQKKEEKS